MLEPLFRNYTISGDTIESIAERELRNSATPARSCRSNPLLSPDLLVPGKTIRIPLDPENIRGRLIEPPALDTRYFAGRAGRRRSDAARPSGGGQRTCLYTIQSDDM